MEMGLGVHVGMTAATLLAALIDCTPAFARYDL